jgi:hypothetical protein
LNTAQYVLQRLYQCCGDQLKEPLGLHDSRSVFLPSLSLTNSVFPETVGSSRFERTVWVQESVLGGPKGDQPLLKRTNDGVASWQPDHACRPLPQVLSLDYATRLIVVKAVAPLPRAHGRLIPPRVACSPRRST